MDDPDDINELLKIDELEGTNELESEAEVEPNADDDDMEPELLEAELVLKDETKDNDELSVDTSEVEVTLGNVYVPEDDNVAVDDKLEKLEIELEKEPLEDNIEELSLEE